VTLKTMHECTWLWCRCPHPNIKPHLFIVVPFPSTHKAWERQLKQRRDKGERWDRECSNKKGLKKITKKIVFWKFKRSNTFSHSVQVATKTHSLSVFKVGVFVFLCVCVPFQAQQFYLYLHVFLARNNENEASSFASHAPPCSPQTHLDSCLTRPSCPLTSSSTLFSIYKFNVGFLSRFSPFFSIFVFFSWDKHVQILNVDTFLDVILCLCVLLCLIHYLCFCFICCPCHNLCDFWWSWYSTVSNLNLKIMTST